MGCWSWAVTSVSTSITSTCSFTFPTFIADINTSLLLRPPATPLSGPTKHRAHRHEPEIEFGPDRTRSVFAVRCDIKARLRRHTSCHVTPLTAPHLLWRHRIISGVLAYLWVADNNSARYEDYYRSSRWPKRYLHDPRVVTAYVHNVWQVCPIIVLLNRVVRTFGGIVVRARDLWSGDREFGSRPMHCRVA